MCGDGRFLNITSECDDGNLEDGDGCSSHCTVEYGYVCKGDTNCRDVIAPVLLLTAVEKPNVLVLEFSDDVYLLDEKALEKTNLNVRVDGPEKRYDFKWRVILS